MTQPHRILSYTDPRLALRVNDADPADPLTRAAMRILEDMLAPHRDALLSAPAIGLPVRLIAMRRGEQVHFLLNPRLTEANELRVNRGETTPLTGPFRRNTWRAYHVVLQSTEITGQPRQIELRDGLAIAAQQAFELFDHLAPFGWTTAFHHNWGRARDAATAARFEAIQRGLYSAPETGDGPLAFVDLNEIELRCDAATPLCRIDALNPMAPRAARDRALFAALLAACALRHLVMLDPKAISVAVAALALLPGLTIHHAPQGWPTRAMAAMGLAPAMLPLPVDGDGVPGDSAIRKDASARTPSCWTATTRCWPRQAGSNDCA